VLVLFSTTTPSAFAYCMEPTAPYRKPTKPTVPFCVNEFTNTHTCDDWQIDTYNSEIDTFNFEYPRYVKALNLYLDEAVAYAQCELDSLD
jgi:hypothetical protein